MMPTTDFESAVAAASDRDAGLHRIDDLFNGA